MTDNLKEIKRGEDAERLIDNPVYKEAVGKVREGIISAMQSSSLGDESTHHRLVIALQLLSQIEKSIQEVATTGKMAKIQAANGTFSSLRAAAGF
jgi:hypothetical protein